MTKLITNKFVQYDSDIMARFRYKSWAYWPKRDLNDLLEFWHLSFYQIERKK